MSEPRFSPADARACPSWLSALAKREWRRVAPELARLGLLTRVDVAALAGYCQSYAHWVEAELFIREHGTTYTLRTDKGEVKGVFAVPQVGIVKAMLDKVRQFAAEFGFTPSARGRIEVEKAGGNVGTQSEFKEYLRLRAEVGSEAGEAAGTGAEVLQ
jgi:P27 family predicted phage terminase small subunit